MKLKRFFYMAALCLKKNGFERARYLKQYNYFRSMGEKCFYQPRYLPPEPELIKFHDNVVVASNVYFITHDVIHYLFRSYKPEQEFSLNLGAIEVGSNVFIGSNTTILPDTKIEDNVIIGAGSIVSGLIRSGGVYAGVPAKRIGEFDDMLQKRTVPDPDLRNKVDRYDDIWKEFIRKWEK